MSEARPLTICGTVPVYCHPDWRAGGMARTATDLMMELARRGHRVTMISPTLDGDHHFEIPEQRSFFDGRFNLLYSTVERSTRFGVTGHGVRELLEPLLALGDVDLVHVHSFMNPWSHRAITTARSAGVPYFIQDHGKLTPRWWLRTNTVPKWIYLKLTGMGQLRDAACVIPSAPIVAEQIRARFPEIRCEACTNGLDPAEFEGPLPPRPLAEPYVLFLGWLDPRKNPAMLVEAFARVAERTKPWRLALVGPDSYGQADTLRELTARLGVEDRVVMPGMARGEQKLAWLRHAGLYVLPSEGEGLSLAMLEAVACGLPCLLTEGCNYPEIEQWGAGWILPIEASAWADAMARLINDEPARREAGANARRLFEQRHTLSAVGAALEDLLRRNLKVESRK